MKQHPLHQSNRALDILPGITFILFLLLGLCSALFALKGKTLSTENFSQKLLRGGWTADIDEQLDEGMAFRQRAVEVFSLLEYRLFRQGREGVIVGSDDWLYTAEEFTFYEDEAQAIADNIALMKEAKATLEAQGTKLIVALVPAKARVYPEHLGRYRLPNYAAPRYQNVLHTLQTEGFITVDLLEALSHHKAGTPLFLRTDTHWTVEGADVAARAIAQSSSQHFNLTGLFQERYTTNILASRTYQGDLLGFIPLGPWQALGPAPDELTEAETVLVEGKALSLGLFDEVRVPVVLIGSSYSANPNWNFAGALREHLGADVLNLAQEGMGPIVPMLEYLDGSSFRDSPPELVVWEFPERFAPVKYPHTLQLSP